MVGKRAHLSFLRTTGAQDFVHNKRHLRKLDLRVAQAGVLIGYDDDKPTYRIYVPETGQATSTRNVIFIEMPSVAIFKATGARGKHDDDELVYEKFKLDLDSTEDSLDKMNKYSNDCITDLFDGITDL